MVEGMNLFLGRCPYHEAITINIFSMAFSWLILQILGAEESEAIWSNIACKVKTH